MGRIIQTLSWLAVVMFKGVCGYLGFYLGTFIVAPLLVVINSLLPQWLWNVMLGSVVASAVYDFWTVLTTVAPLPQYPLNDLVVAPVCSSATSLGPRVRMGRPAARGMFLPGPMPAAHRCIRFGRTRLR
jgi:hypothetical protein